MSARRKLILIAAAAAAALLAIVGVAWHESRFPLRYLDADRVNLAEVAAVKGRRSRALTDPERRELCRLLRAAPEIESFQGRRSVRVELETLDYGRVLVYDFDGPGANVEVDFDRPGGRAFTLRSGRLGDFLARLAGELARGRTGPRGGGE